MGSRFARYIVYIVLAPVSFLIFLYWTFPYEVVKDRLIYAIESQLGGNVDVKIRDLNPYWFTGVDVDGLTISDTRDEAPVVLMDCKRLKARASLFSLLFGRTSVSFDLEAGKGEISGSFRESDEAVSIDAELDDFDIGSIAAVSARFGIRITSRLNGEVILKIDRQRPMRTTGKIVLSPSELKIIASELKAGEFIMPLPDLSIAKGRDSKIKVDIDGGAAAIDTFSLAGGDFGLNMKGKIFLSPKFENYRLNLTGNFTASKALHDALPFLFIVDQQKSPDGSYPISVTGRFEKPIVKVGSFTVPL